MNIDDYYRVTDAENRYYSAIRSLRDFTSTYSVPGVLTEEVLNRLTDVLEELKSANDDVKRYMSGGIARENEHDQV